MKISLAKGLLFSITWKSLRKVPSGSQICFAFAEGHYTAILDFLKLDFQAFDSVYCLFDILIG